MVGLGAACEISQHDMASDAAHVEHLSQRLKDRIFSELDHVILNGHPEETYKGCLNLSFAYVEGESLLMALKVSYKRLHLKKPNLSDARYVN